VDARIEAVFRAWEEFDAETDKDMKVACRQRFHDLIDGFLREENIPLDRYGFIHEAGEQYRNWRRRPH
jgi:hypothetical protein